MAGAYPAAARVTPPLPGALWRPGARRCATFCDRGARSNLASDRACLYDHGRMTGPRAKAIMSSVDGRGSLRAHADVLAGAFGIREAVPYAPIVPTGGADG